MAYSFHDLKELGIDCDEQIDSLSKQFNAAANHLQKILPQVDSEMLLTLYGYYKQGSEGVCTIPKPSWYDVRGKAKWEAWNKLGAMPQNEAKTLYIESIRTIDPQFDFPEGDSAPQESWVRVSTLQTQPVVTNSNKTVVDFIKDGNASEVSNILARKTISLNALDDDGLGLIHWAADSGHAKILDVLVGCGADVNLQDTDGQTALHYASSCGHIECIKLLLCKGARTDLLDREGSDAKSNANDAAVRELFN